MPSDCSCANLQPEDWDDKEYIPDPNDKKPEVCVPILHKTSLFFLSQKVPIKIMMIGVS